MVSSGPATWGDRPQRQVLQVTVGRGHRRYLGEGLLLLIAALLVEGTWLVVGSRTGLSAEEAAWSAAAPTGGRPLVDGIYVLALEIWTGVLGLSEAASRGYSLVCVFVMLVGVWAAARRLLNPLPAAVAPILVAASPLVAAQAAEVSPFAEAAGFAALATAIYLLAGRTRWWVLYGVIVAATLATLPGAGAVFVGHALHAVWSLRTDRGRSVGALLALGVALVPLILGVALRTFGVSGPGTVLPTLVEPVPPPWAGPAVILLALGLAGLLAPPRPAWVPRVLLLATPWILLAPIVTTGRADARFLILAVPAGAMALAGALDLIGRGLAVLARELVGSETNARAPRAFVALVGALLLVAAGGAAFARYEAERSDYRGLVFQILREGRSGDLIVLGTPGVREVVEYYNRGRAPLLELPFELGATPNPTAATRATGATPNPPAATPVLLEATAEAMLASVMTIPRQLWVVGMGADSRVRPWLAERFYATSSYSYGGAQVGVYSTEPDMRSGQGRTVFGNIVELPEAALPSNAVPRDFPIAIRLSWRAREPVGTRLGVLIELVESNRIVARHEGEPVAGTRPTSTWEPGEIIVDRIALTVPEAMATGSYTVRLVLFDLNTRARWRLADGRETVDLGMVRVGNATRPPL